MNIPLEFNKAFDGLKPSSTLYINETVNKLWAQGHQVFHMGFGESRFDVHPRLQTALSTHANKKSYLPARGLPQLTAQVASYYSQKLGLDFAEEQVIVGPGSKSLIYGLQMILDADVFLPTPSWVSYGPQAILLGNSFSYVPSSPNDNYRFNIEEFDRLVKASENPCKLLIINSPNNPSGEVWPAELLREIADYCRSNGIWVLSDEIYFEVCHDGNQHVSISKFYPEGTIVMGGLSKHLSIGGWRLGVALMPDSEQGQELMRKMVLFASESWSGVAAPIQYAAVEAYACHDDLESYVADCTAIHGIRTRHIKSALTDLGIVCSGGEGAFYLTANFDRYAAQLKAIGIQTSDQLAAHLLDRYRIATLPGGDFGMPKEQQSLRLSTSYLDMETEFDAQRIFDLYLNEEENKRLMSASNHPNTHDAIIAFKDFMASLAKA
jgi:aspartate/methionine/tyrosine aminotransferase